MGMLKKIFALFRAASQVKDAIPAVIEEKRLQRDQHMDASLFGGSALPVAQYGDSGTPAVVMESTRAVLRDDRTKGKERYLTATFSSGGNLVFSGQDLSVEEFLGYSEYEWAWTIAKADLPALAHALDVKSDLLAAIQNRFSGDDAAKLGPFFDEHKIAYEHWSRVGD